MIIGYYFHSADHWGKAAETVFKDPEPNFTSNFVWGECFGVEGGGKCHDIYQKISREFRRAIAHLKRGESLASLSTVSSDWKIHEIIDGIVVKHGVEPNAVLTLFIAVKDRYDEVCFQRKANLENRQLLVIHQRASPHKELWDKFHSAMTDADDIEVVLDAHDLSGQVLEVVLITGDFRDIVTHKGMILAATSIKDIRYLGEFG